MNKTNFTEKILLGLSVSPGINYARVCLLGHHEHNTIPFDKLDFSGIENEKKRLATAIDEVSKKLSDLIIKVNDSIGKTESDIFIALKMMIDDPEIKKKISLLIEEKKCNTEFAVDEVFDSYRNKLEAVGDEYIRERASDISDLKRHLLDSLRNSNKLFLCDETEECVQGHNRIVVAKELTPTLTFDLDLQNIKGFITERGGPTSHAAILARAIGVPSISGIENVYEKIFCGTKVLLDSNSGKIILWPSKKTLNYYPELIQTHKEKIEFPSIVPKIKVLANISRSSDIDDVLKVNAEGVGLYRTEMEFISAGTTLDEEQQFLKYVEVIEKVKGLPVFFRLLDIGADKTLSFLNIPEEENPALGFRGARLLLNRPDLLIPQARALARASQKGPVSVMYPMITCLDQFLKLKKMFEEAVDDISKGTIKHGVLFEVPSACLEAREIFSKADFGSIGTNDLVQYLFAVDRNNNLVAYDYQPDNKIFWNLIKKIIAAAKEFDKPLSICGELGGDSKYIPKLMKMGIKMVSANTYGIPNVRRAAATVK